MLCLKLYIIFCQAYVFELEDEYAESDIPTTLIRSKADCPGMEVLVFCIHNKIAEDTYCI
jgi:IK cytokine